MTDGSLIAGSRPWSQRDARTISRTTSGSKRLIGETPGSALGKKPPPGDVAEALQIVNVEDIARRVAEFPEVADPAEQEWRRRRQDR